MCHGGYQCEEKRGTHMPLIQASHKEHFRMKGILYLPEVGGAADRLKGLIEVLIPGDRLEVYRSLDAFSRRFREPLNDLDVVVLMATNHEEFMSIFSIQPLLRDRRLILITPDQKEETVALAHRLRPRLLASIDDDLSKVTMVLSKMLKDE